jgi:hypothetical protein
VSTPTFFSFPYANYFSLDLPCTLSFKKIGHSLGNNHMWLQPNKFCGMNHSTNLWRPYWYKTLVVDVFFFFFFLHSFLKISTLGYKEKVVESMIFAPCQMSMFVFLTYLLLGFPSSTHLEILLFFLLRNGCPCHLPLLVWLRIVGPLVLISSANQIRYVYFLTIQNIENIYIYIYI